MERKLRDSSAWEDRGYPPFALELLIPLLEALNAAADKEDDPAPPEEMPNTGYPMPEPDEDPEEPGERDIEIEEKQLNRKFKHAKHFGILENNNGLGRMKWADAIRAHMRDPATYRSGTYGYEQGSRAYFNPRTNNVVIVDKNGKFVSGWKLEPGTKQWNHYVKNGVLK